MIKYRWKRKEILENAALNEIAYALGLVKGRYQLGMSCSGRIIRKVLLDLERLDYSIQLAQGGLTAWYDKLGDRQPRGRYEIRGIREAEIQLQALYFIRDMYVNGDKETIERFIKKYVK